MTDRRPASPGPRRHVEAAQRLRDAIGAGRFGAAGLLPGERELAAILDVSRTTLRRSLAVLIEEGLVAHRQGMGTFVTGTAPNPPAQGGVATAPAPPAPGPGSFGLGTLETAARALERSEGPAPPRDAMLLGVSPFEPVARRTRLVLLGDVAAAIERVSVPSRLLSAGWDDAENTQAALARNGHPPVRLLQRLRAAAIEGADAGTLGVAPRHPGLVVETLGFAAEGRPCFHARTLHRADLFDAVVETTERPGPHRPADV